MFERKSSSRLLSKLLAAAFCLVFGANALAQSTATLQAP